MSTQVTRIPGIIPTSSSRCASNAIPPCPSNEWDACESANAAQWKRIYRDPNFAKLQLPVRYWNLSEPPFDTMPPDAIRLNQIGNAILTPGLVANANNTILQYTVPFGFDGIINENMNIFVPQAGAGFQDGSGLLTWRIYINQYLVTYYTAINTSMGSLSNSGNLNHSGGIRIRSNQTVTYVVFPTATALATLDPNGQIICGFRGWIYPMH